MNGDTGYPPGLEWLLRPTLPARLAMVLTVTVFLAFCFLVSDASLDRLVAASPLTVRDKAGPIHLFGRIRRFLLDNDRHRQVDLALIGGSTLRDAFWSEDEFAEAIKRLNGEKIRVLDLTSGGQSLLESWALAELAACNGAEVVILGANVNRHIDQGVRDRRNPILSTGILGPEVESFVHSGSVNPRHATLTHRMFDRPAFVLEIAGASLKAVSRKILHGEEAVTLDNLRHPLVGRARKERFRKKTVGLVEKRFAAAQGWEAKYAMFERLRATVERCGGRFVAFVPATNPEMLDASQSPAYSAAYAAHNEHMRDALGDPSRLVVFNEKFEFPPEAFFDWGHLATEEAIRSSAAEMALMVAPMLREFDL